MWKLENKKNVVFIIYTIYVLQNPKAFPYFSFMENKNL